MAKKGHSEIGLFGDIHHYDERGKKIGTSCPGLFGGYNNYALTAIKSAIVTRDSLVDLIIMIITDTRQVIVTRGSSVGLITMTKKVKRQVVAHRGSLATTNTKMIDYKECFYGLEQ